MPVAADPKYDSKLPRLLSALDDDHMRTVFSSISDVYTAALNVNRVTHRTLKYRPGKRCVIEYQLDSGNGSGSRSKVIGKIYRKDRGRKAFRNMSLLWQSSQSSIGKNASFAMPEPLGYISELGMVLQSRVPGKLLSQISDSQMILTFLPAVGLNLALLHRLDINGVLKPMSLAQHIKRKCHPGPNLLCKAYPQLSRLVADIYAQLLASETSLPMDKRPVHGDLNLTQIIAQGGRTAFIDFDGFCTGDPALDIANFLTTLDLHFGSESNSLKSEFLGEYLRLQPRSALRGLSVYLAFAYFRRAMIALRSQSRQKNFKHIQVLLVKSHQFITQQPETIEVSDL